MLLKKTISLLLLALYTILLTHSCVSEVGHAHLGHHTFHYSDNSIFIDDDGCYVHIDNNHHECHHNNSNHPQHHHDNSYLKARNSSDSNISHLICCYLASTPSDLTFIYHIDIVNRFFLSDYILSKNSFFRQYFRRGPPTFA